MPIYEYECSDCKTIFEKIRPFKSADQKVECERCQSVKTNRIISTFFSCSSGNEVNQSNSSCASCSGGNCSTCH